MNPFAWLHDDQLVEADGISFGPGFIWPAEPTGPSCGGFSSGFSSGFCQCNEFDSSFSSAFCGGSSIDEGGQSIGEGTVTGTLALELDGQPTGEATAEGTLSATQGISELDGQPAGEATVEGLLLLGSGGESLGEGTIVEASLGEIRELDGGVTGEGTVTGWMMEARVTSLFTEVLAPADEEVRSTASFVEVLAIEHEPMAGGTSGDAQAEADLESLDFHTIIWGDATATGELLKYIASAGRGTVVTATLDNGFSELDGEAFGDTEAVANLLAIPLGIPPYQPVNYPFTHGDANIVEISETNTEIEGVAEVEGTLDIPFDASSEGEGYIDVTGAIDNPTKFDGESMGDSEVVGEMFVSGTGGGEAELDGQSVGEAIVYAIGQITDTDGPPTTRAYYTYGNVITGFDPTDLAGGADGHVRDFNRYLSLYTNINVAFDYTDDASGNDGFVSQTYPDGDIIRDFARFKYQYLLVIPGIEPPDCRLTIGPAPRSPKDLAPTPRPPRREGR